MPKEANYPHRGPGAFIRKFSFCNTKGKKENNEEIKTCGLSEIGTKRGRGVDFTIFGAMF